MNDKALKVLCTLATGTAIATSMQATAIADPAKTPNFTYKSTVTGTITADVLNIRSNHNTSSNIIGKINYNTKVSILEISNGWYKIKYNNTTGWICGEYVKLDSNSNTVQASKNGVVTATALNVRSAGTTNSRIIGSLAKNAKVQIISTSNGWHKIKYNKPVVLLYLLVMVGTKLNIIILRVLLVLNILILLQIIQTQVMVLIITIVTLLLIVSLNLQALLMRML